ncbi:MAG: DUF5615 family PIN-like protein [Terriglobales bacterium]|jgi:predicted nuclease of predicted toxin-antitoxin system
MKLLIDQCLSEELAKLARERGHGEASHVAWMGKRGWKDWPDPRGPHEPKIWR